MQSDVPGALDWFQGSAVAMPQPHAESVQQSQLLNSLEEGAFRRPEAKCIQFGNRSITSKELHEQSRLIASALNNSGIGPGNLVAIYLDRSVDLVAAMIGVLRSGAAYLPIDGSVPEQRVDFMLSDSGASAVITQANLRDRVRRAPTYLVSELLQIGSSDASKRAEYEPVGDDLAYVIYTSGSTGRPKGVEILHRSVAASVESIRQELQVCPSDRLLAVTSPSFDVSGMEIFLTLTSGGVLVLFPQMQVMPSDLLRSAIEENAITLLFGTPTLWRLILDSGWKGNPQLRAVIGGEPLDADLARRLVEKTGALWNHYGPTEATIVSTTRLVNPRDVPVPIGAPLPHVRTFVVDKDVRPVPAGTAGELLIGGDVLARGYRNHPELTAARFIQFDSGDGRVERVYRTGDLVRTRPDGALEFVGRIDNQVKVRGFRIELEEIESVLAEYPQVSDCAVVARETSPDDRTLVAYVRSASKGTISAEGLRTYLSTRLPGYMVPSHIVTVELFPLTVNGKIDRQELSRREVQFEEERPASSSKDPVVRELVSIWRRVLKVPHVGLNDNFFELGGHSILAAKLFTEIRDRLHKSLPLSTLFAAPTVASLARIVAQAGNVSWSPLVPIRTSGIGTPFFGVHPVGGNVLIFKKLSECMSSRPFYALQARGLNGNEDPHTSIEEMAADYLNYVQQVQPSGPYLLGGYSAGGLVAFEMARLLKQMGQQVKLVVLFDTYLHAQSVPDSLSAHRPVILKAFNGISRRLWQMRNLRGENRLVVVARDFARFWSTVKLKTYPQLNRIGTFRLDTLSGFLLALRNYRPKPLDTDAFLFLADANAPPAAATLPAIWQGLVTGRLEVIHLPVDHDHLLEDPNAGLLATTIEDAFRRNSTSR
jgi:amino acid adenylation domain-containing protein